MIKTKHNKLGFTILIFLLTYQISICQSEQHIYNIGYKSLIFNDFSRVGNIFDAGDSLSNYREIVVSMWYPSTITASDTKTRFDDFLSTIELDYKLDYNPLDSIIESSDKFADYFGLGDIQLSELKNYPTQSYNNSDHLSEKFPLVIYIPGMNGFSFENHILCEEIAKHGYIVISFNSKGTDKRWMEPNTIDYENQIRDVQFLIGMTHNYSFIDKSKICAIGHSIGGYVNILTKIRDNRISSLVSLDGSIIHDLERSDEFTYRNFDKVNCPILSTSSQNFNKASVYLDRMPYADRYYYQTTTLKHRDFKSITYLLKNDLDSEKFNDYQMLSNLIVSFIDKCNVQKDIEFNELSNKLSESGILIKNYLPSVPDFEDFKTQASNSGYDDLDSMYNIIVGNYPFFTISEQELYDWGNNLRYNGYFKQAVNVYELLINLYPHYISGYNGLTRTLLLQNKNDEAIKVYKQALEMNPDNESIKRKLNKLTTEQSN